MNNIPHSKTFISKSDITEVGKVMASGMIAQGAKVAEFEKAVSKFQGTKYSAAVSSGTAALHLVLLSLKIGKGDEVIVPSFVCTALLNAVYYTGAAPRVVDADPRTLSLSLEETKKNLTLKTKALILPHMFGQPADVKPFVKLGVPVIEDCAQSIGASINGKAVGNEGTAAVFSFYATKMMTTGEGGMVTSGNKKIVDFIKDRRDYDNRKDYGMRFNYKMTDMSAALGISQLRELPSMILKRKALAKIYSHAFAGLDIGLPPLPSVNGPVYFRYIIKTKSGARLIGSLRKAKIDAAKPVFKPLHEYLLLDPSSFPHTVSLMKETVSLPIYPGLETEEQERIITQVRKSLK